MIGDQQICMCNEYEYSNHSDDTCYVETFFTFLKLIEFHE